MGISSSTINFTTSVESNSPENCHSRSWAVYLCWTPCKWIQKLFGILVIIFTTLSWLNHLFSIDLIVDLQALLNFTYEFIELTDENVEFGIDVHSNGSFNGMIGMLQRNEADVLLADIPITSGTDWCLNRFESKVLRKVCLGSKTAFNMAWFRDFFKRLSYRTSKAYRLFGCIFGNGFQVSVCQVWTKDNLDSYIFSYVTLSDHKFDTWAFMEPFDNALWLMIIFTVILVSLFMYISNYVSSIQFYVVFY